ncbi:hypothetical protein [Zobellia uliginosa]|nr:hypothetical protein [Zobellia uliginosa]
MEKQDGTNFIGVPVIYHNLPEALDSREKKKRLRFSTLMEMKP